MCHVYFFLNDISLSPTIHSLTWHPFISASISRRLPMLRPLGRITLVCIHTWSLSDKYNYFTAVIPCYAKYNFHSTSPTFSACRNLHKMLNAVLLNIITMGIGQWHRNLWYAMLCYATLRYATLRYATLRYATLRYATVYTDTVTI